MRPVDPEWRHLRDAAAKRLGALSSERIVEIANIISHLAPQESHRIKTKGPNHELQGAL